MKHDCFKIPLIVLAAVLFLFSMSTVCIAGGSFTFKWGKDTEPENNQVKHTYKHKKKGEPPPHAPAHGYRAKHKYRYYPSSNVYADKTKTTAKCHMDFNLKGWSVFYKTAEGNGRVTCSNGQHANVKINVTGGGLSFGKDE